MFGAYTNTVDVVVEGSLDFTQKEMRDVSESALLERTSDRERGGEAQEGAGSTGW